LLKQIARKRREDWSVLMQRVPLLSTKAETKIMMIIARKMMVATTRTGLNIWGIDGTWEIAQQSRNEHGCDQDQQESAHEFHLLGELFAKN
jgi:hypothetical protein